MQLRGVLFPARIHGFILGHLNAVDLVREVLVCVPAGEMIAFAHGSFAELHRGAGAIPLSFIFRAAIGHIGESITCTPTVATIPSMAAVSVERVGIKQVASHGIRSGIGLPVPCAAGIAAIGFHAGGNVGGIQRTLTLV